MSQKTASKRRNWFDSIPWWLWAAVAVTQVPLIFFRIDDFVAAATKRDRIDMALMAAQATVWCLLALGFAVRAGRRAGEP